MQMNAHFMQINEYKKVQFFQFTASMLLRFLKLWKFSVSIHSILISGSLSLPSLASTTLLGVKVPAFVPCNVTTTNMY